MKRLMLATALLVAAPAFAGPYDREDPSNAYNQGYYAQRQREAPPPAQFGDWASNPRNWDNNPRNWNGNPRVYSPDGRDLGYIVPRGYSSDW